MRVEELWVESYQGEVPGEALGQEEGEPLAEILSLPHVKAARPAGQRS